MNDGRKSTAIGMIDFAAIATTFAFAFAFWVFKRDAAGLVVGGVSMFLCVMGFLIFAKGVDKPRRKFDWNEDAPWIGGSALGVVVGSVLPIVIVQSNAPNWLAVLPAAAGVLFFFGGLYVVFRHVRARWCFRCGEPRERWNYYWFYCPDCREGRWYDDPDPEDAHIDYRKRREPYYQQRSGESDGPAEDFAVEPFTGAINGVTYHVDCLTADTIDVWCDLPEDGMALPPYAFLRFEGDHSGNKHAHRREDIDLLIAMGADYIDIGKMGDMVAVGFPRESAFGDDQFLQSAAQYIVRLYEVTVSGVESQ